MAGACRMLQIRNIYRDKFVTPPNALDCFHSVLYGAKCLYNILIIPIKWLRESDLNQRRSGHEPEDLFGSFAILDRWNARD